MFDIGSTELLLIVIVAVIVIGPKDLPRALYKVGQVVGKARAMSRHFRTGIDAMMREAELAELEKKWAAENKRIMEEHPPETTYEKAPEALPASEPEDDGLPDSSVPGYTREARAEARAIEARAAAATPSPVVDAGDETPKDGAPA